MSVTLRAKCRDCGRDVEVVNGRFDKHGQCAGWFAIVTDEKGWEDNLESRFTEPRPDCPYPERWHSDDADSTEHEVTALVAAFVGALRPDVVVETGSAWGQTSSAIGTTLAAGGYGGVLHTIEPDVERVEAVRKRCVGLPVEVHETTSMAWEPVPNIGFAWLDSLHHLRVPEFRKLHPFLVPHAIVGFHDTGPHQGPLAEQIAQLEIEGLLLPIYLPTPRGVAFGEVLHP